MKSVIYALEGIASTVKSEINFRIHLLVAALVIIAGFCLNISLFEWVIVLLLIGGMLAFELANTAIERIADFVSKDYHPLVKAAKDAGAGAVLVYAFVSVIIGIIIFVPKIVQLLQ